MLLTIHISLTVFFTERTDRFVKFWLNKSLQASWYWYRYEYAVQRRSIHCHGVAKLQNDPGLCELTAVALQGFLASKYIKEHQANISNEDLQELKNKEKRGGGEMLRQLFANMSIFY